MVQGQSPWSEERSLHEASDIFLIQSRISYQNYHINFGNLVYMVSVGACLHPRIMVRGSEGADDIFLFQRLNISNISEENYHIILKNLDYMLSMSVPSYNGS